MPNVKALNSELVRDMIAQCNENDLDIEVVSTDTSGHDLDFHCPSYCASVRCMYKSLSFTKVTYS